MIKDDIDGLRLTIKFKQKVVSIDIRILGGTSFV